MKRKEIYKLLEEFINRFEQIDGEVLKNVPDAYEVITVEYTEKIYRLLNSEEE